MTTLEIDGVGKVEVGDEFLRLTPEQQAIEVDAIAASVRGQPTITPPDDWRQREAQANLAAGSAPGDGLVPGAIFDLPGAISSGAVSKALTSVETGGPGQLAQRGFILPVGKTQEGETVPAVPGAIMGIVDSVKEAHKTITDLLSGRRRPDQIRPEEMLNVGMLFGGLSPGAGTGKGIAAAAESRAMVGPVKPATVPPVPPAGQVQVLGYRPGADAARDAAKKVLMDEAEVSYQVVDNSGALIAARRVQNLDTEVKTALKQTGYDPDLHKNAAVPLKRIEEAASQGDLAFTDLVKIRRVIQAAEGKAAKEGGDSELNVLGRIKDKVDDLAYGFTQADMRSGSADVSQALARANDLWARSAKLNTITVMVDRAMTTSGSTTGARPFEGALVNEFKALAKNKSRMRPFTPDEQRIIKLISRGTTGEKIARGFAKLSPTNIVSGGVSGSIGAQIGAAILGGTGGTAVGAGTALAVGKTAQLIARALLKRNIRELETAIANGGKSRWADETISKAMSAQKRLGIETVRALEDKRQR